MLLSDILTLLEVGTDSNCLHICFFRYQDVYIQHHLRNCPSPHQRDFPPIMCTLKVIIISTVTETPTVHTFF